MCLKHSIVETGMICTRQWFNYDSFISKDNWRIFDLKGFVDFLHYNSRINCLTGAIISETRHDIKYILITKCSPPHGPPPVCGFMKTQAGLKEWPTSSEGGRERRPQQE